MDYSIIEYGSDSEKKYRKELYEFFKNCPIPEDQILSNLGLFLTSKVLSRILFMNHIYKKNINIPGVIFEFGTHWGQNVLLFSALRSIYEPYNRHRKIIGFDTFEGFPSISEEDGNSELMVTGKLRTTEDYHLYLDSLMSIQEKLNPLNHIKKYDIIKGNAVHTVKKYLDENPQTIISMVYFDFDIYEPTRQCLSLIKPHLVKGSVMGFDELNDQDSPGETVALNESFGLSNIKLKRYKYTSRTSYFIVE